MTDEVDAGSHDRRVGTGAPWLAWRLLSAAPTTSHARAIALALAVTLLWSSSWVLIRWGLDAHGLDPIGFAGLRYGLAVLVLAAWVASRPSDRRVLASLGRRQLALLAALGVIFYAITQGAQFVALDSQPAATTSLILALTPFLVAALSTAALAEPPGPLQLVGAVVIAIGAGLYFSGDLGFTRAGLTASLVGLGANVVASLLGRSVNRTMAVPARVVTVVSMAVGAALLLVTGVVVEGPPQLEPTGWAIVIWLAVVNTALAFTWWNHSLRVLTATESAGINNTMLVQIGLLAWIFLDEAPGALEWAGMLAVSAGVFLAQRRRR